MMMKRTLWLLALILGLAPRLVPAQIIGEPAPALQIKAWAKGQPVGVKPGTNVYLIEIWSTTSLGCRAAIPILNELQERYQTNGLMVVGISDESPEAIATYLQGDGSAIKYTIAADDARQTGLAYMMPLKQRGIPYTFVVGTNGQFLWHGFPKAGLGDVLARVMSGTYDVERAKKNEAAGRQMEQYLTLSQHGDFRAKPAGEVLLASRTNDIGLLSDIAYKIATVPNLAHRDFALAFRALDEADKLDTTNKASVMIVRAICLFESGKHEDGLSMATQAINSAQSPLVKTNIENLYRSMQSRMDLFRYNQMHTNSVENSPDGTNQISPAPAAK